MLVEALLAEQVRFCIRMRKDKYVLYCGEELLLKNLPWYEKDTDVSIYGKDLRVVVSEKLSERKDSKGKEEAWYILTNDTFSSKERIISSYYFRFEIEETFKDLKHISQLGTFFRIKKAQTFRTLLWFCLLPLWISYLINSMELFLQKRITQKKRKRLSFVRFFFEQIELAKSQTFFSSFAM